MRCTTCRSFTEVPKFEQQDGVVMSTAAAYYQAQGASQAPATVRGKGSTGTANPPWRKPIIDLTPATESAPVQGNNFLESGIMNRGVIGGSAAMVVGSIWFAIALVNDSFILTGPALFALGLAAVMKSIMGNARA